MTTRLRWLVLSITLACLSTASCGETPASPDPVPVELSQEVVSNTGWVDVSITLFDVCNGELVDFVTQRKIITTVTDDGAGGFHLGIHRAWRGTGVGQVTGTVYNMNFPNQIQLYAGGPFPEVFTQRIANNLVTQGASDNRLFSLIAHTTINANGDVTTAFGDIVLECVG